MKKVAMKRLLGVLILVNVLGSRLLYAAAENVEGAKAGENKAVGAEPEAAESEAITPVSAGAVKEAIVASVVGGRSDHIRVIKNFSWVCTGCGAMRLREGWLDKVCMCGVIG